MPPCTGGVDLKESVEKSEIEIRQNKNDETVWSIVAGCHVRLLPHAPPGACAGWRSVLSQGTNPTRMACIAGKITLLNTHIIMTKRTFFTEYLKWAMFLLLAAPLAVGLSACSDDNDDEDPFDEEEWSEAQWARIAKYANMSSLIRPLAGLDAGRCIMPWKWYTIGNEREACIVLKGLTIRCRITIW